MKKVLKKRGSTVKMNGQDMSVNSTKERFIAWLTTQPNSRGQLYLERVARQYARYLRTEPSKLINDLAPDARNVFSCETVQQFEKMYQLFLSSSNYKEVNSRGHQTFSAGLSAYRRYVWYLEACKEAEMSGYENIINVQSVMGEPRTLVALKPLRVDFNHPELCTGCDPMTCTVEGNDFSMKNWRDILASLTEAFLESKPQAMSLYHTSLFSKS